MTRRQGIATVVLNRPPMNALNKTQWVRLQEAFRSLSGDESVRGVILRGAGERAFSAGADIQEFDRERSDVQQARQYGKVMHAALEALDGCPHPTVALIRGVCRWRTGSGLHVRPENLR